MTAAEPAVVPLALAIERAAVLGFLDYPTRHEPPARTARLLDEVLPEARLLAAGRGSFRPLAVEQAEAIGLQPIQAEALVVGLVTAGPAIESRVSELLAAGELARAVLLDAAGSAAAEEAADRLTARIVSAPGGGAEGESTHGGGTDGTAACRLSPGYGPWALGSQPALFARLPHAALGVTLTASLLMVPRKSISFALWLGAFGPIAPSRAGCVGCSLARCRYRRPTGRGGPGARTKRAAGARRRTRRDD